VRISNVSLPYPYVPHPVFDDMHLAGKKPRSGGETAALAVASGISTSNVHLTNGNSSLQSALFRAYFTAMTDTLMEGRSPSRSSCMDGSDDCLRRNQFSAKQ